MTFITIKVPFTKSFGRIVPMIDLHIPTIKQIQIHFHDMSVSGYEDK